MFKRLFLLTISLFLVSSSFAVKKEFLPYYNTAKQLNKALKKYYSYGSTFGAGLLDVEKSTHKEVRRGFVDRNGKLVIPCVFSPEFLMETGLSNEFDDLGFCFVHDPKGGNPEDVLVGVGCIDTLGRMFIPYKYDYITYDSLTNRFYAFICLKDTCIRQYHEFIYSRNGQELSNKLVNESDLLSYSCNDSTYGYKLCDSIVCPCQFVDTTTYDTTYGFSSWSFYPGPYCFTSHKGKYLMIDSTGHHLNETLFSSIVVYNYLEECLGPIPEHQDQIAVSVESNSGKELWGVINKDGRMLIPCVYDSLRDSQTGYYFVSSQGHNSLVDSLNNVLCSLPDSLDFHFLDMVAIPNSKAYLLVSSEKIWVFDENHLLSELPYLNGLGISPFSNGYAMIVKTDFEDFPAPPPPPGEETSLPTMFKREKNSWGYMDANLNIVVPCIFEDVYPVAKNGLAEVCDGENFFFIDIRKASQIKH